MDLCSLLQKRYVAYIATDGEYLEWWGSLQEFMEKIAGDGMVAPRLEDIAHAGDPGPWLVLEGEKAILENIPGFRTTEGLQGALRFRELPEAPSEEWFREGSA